MSDISILTSLRQDAAVRLEWPRIKSVLSQLAVLPSTQELLNDLEPWMSEVERDRILAYTAERVSLLMRDPGQLVLEPVDFSAFLNATRIGQTIGALGLFQCLVLLKLMQNAADFNAAEKNRSADFLSPLLAQLTSNIIPQPRLLTVLIRSVNSEGQILSSASDELKIARGKQESARRRIVDELEGMLKNKTIREACQDAVWMIRDGRYVLPVRSDRRSDVSGIPRGVSQSGSTIFVEPNELAAAHLSLEQADIQVNIEEERVLRTLSKSLGDVSDILFDGAEIIEKLDNITARARFAQSINAICPVFHNEPELLPRFSLRGAKHPLFVLENKQCVANDLELLYDDQSTSEFIPPPSVWVLTGPNAGGKTVAMRTVGITVLMARAGLFVCAREALLYSFEEVCVEMGDRQSRADDLSTFSGHLLHLKHVIDIATPRTLILLDEGFVGTDPGVGVALARATLESLASRGATVIITTHFSDLKLLADSDKRFLNASMEFESQQLRPTYKLLNGIPGQSYALELGARLQYDAQILVQARQYAGDESLKLENILADLQRKKAAVVEELENQENIRIELEQSLAEIKAERSETIALRDEFVSTYRTRLQKRLNAFENRLEIRERQFERQKQDAMRRLNEENNLENKPDSDQKSEELKPKIDARPKEKSAGNLSQDKKERNDEKTRGKTLGDFSALADLKFKIRATEDYEQEESEIEVQSRKFRMPEKMSARELLDEARLSLDSMNRNFEGIDKKFKQDINALAHLQTEKENKSAETIQDSKKAKLVQLERTPDFYKLGMKVKCDKFKDVGEVLRVADSKGLIECKFGMLKTKIHASELRTLTDSVNLGLKGQMKTGAKSADKNKVKAPTIVFLAPGVKAKAPQFKREKNLVDMNIEPVFPHAGNTLDVRGRLVDDALDKVEIYLDKAWQIDQNVSVLLHGHGTGKVKQAVRQFLVHAGYDLIFRPGTQGEGGDGVTIVKFK